MSSFIDDDDEYHRLASLPYGWNKIRKKKQERKTKTNDSDRFDK